MSKYFDAEERKQAMTTMGKPSDVIAKKHKAGNVLEALKAELQGLRDSDVFPEQLSAQRYELILSGLITVIEAQKGLSTIVQSLTLHRAARYDEFVMLMKKVDDLEAVVSDMGGK